MAWFLSTVPLKSRPADSILSKAGLSRNAEDLLVVAKAEEPQPVTDSACRLNKLHAFFMARKAVFADFEPSILVCLSCCRFPRLQKGVQAAV